MKPASIILAAAVLACAAPALAAPSNTCFRMSQARNHTVVDANTLYIAVGQKDVWRISMSNSCLAAKWSSDPLITRTVGGSDMVCRPLDLDLKAGGSGGVSPCIISKIEKMTPAEVAAIPKKLRP